MKYNKESLDEIVSKAQCGFDNKLIYRSQSYAKDYLNGISGYCLCDAKKCPYYEETKEDGSPYCNAPVKRYKEEIWGIGE